MTYDRKKRIKSIVELDPNDLDKVVGGASGGKITPGIHNKVEQKLSTQPNIFTSSEEAKKGA